MKSKGAKETLRVLEEIFLENTRGPYTSHLKLKLCGEMAKRGYRGTIEFSMGEERVYVYFIDRFRNFIDCEEWSVSEAIAFIMKNFKYVI